MFTGIIAELGRVAEIQHFETSLRLRIVAPNVLAHTKAGESEGGGLQVGASVAVNGVCLTVVQSDAEGLSLDCLQATLSKTGLGLLEVGDRVNLEPALAASASFDGHVVQGHVNGTGRIVSLREAGLNRTVGIALPPSLYALCVREASIAVNGVSLTIADMLDSQWGDSQGSEPAQAEGGVVYISIVPHTWENTTFQFLKEGALVNIEIDVFARYIERFLMRYFSTEPGAAVQAGACSCGGDCSCGEMHESSPDEGLREAEVCACGGNCSCGSH